MNKVWIVFQHFPYEGDEIEAIYTNEEQAEAHCSHLGGFPLYFVENYNLRTKFEVPAE